MFFKDPQSFGDGELGPLQKIGISTSLFAKRHPHFYKEMSLGEVRVECLKGLEFIRGLFVDGTWDMLVLDELNIALRDGFLKEEELLALLEAKPQKLELILTGRGTTERITEKADLVSQIKKIKQSL